MSGEKKNDFLEKIFTQIEEYSLSKSNDRWLLAVSGGADSMAMMQSVKLLWENGSLAIEGMHVGHLNHQLRGFESEQDAQFVQEQASRLGLAVTVGRADVQQASLESGESVESAARLERYAFLAKTAQAQGCNKIALAHHADDNVETVIHRIMRGTGIRGLMGIPAKRRLGMSSGGKLNNEIELVRPLLNVRRSEIEEFLRCNEITYRVDSSNLSKTPTRNRIRHDLLPLLARDYNPNIFEALGRLSHIAESFGELLTEDIEAIYPELVAKRAAWGLVLKFDQLKSLTKIQQTEVLHEAFLELQAPLRKMGHKHLRGLLTKLGQASEADWCVELPGGTRVAKRGERLEIWFKKRNSKEDVIGPEEVELLYPGRTSLPDGYLIYNAADGTGHGAHSVVAELGEADSGEMVYFKRTKSFREEMIDVGKVKGSLRVRVRQKGEQFRAIGAPGVKSLGDFFTDQKVPVAIRDRVGLLCDDEGVVWVMGSRIAERVKVTSGTRQVLKLMVR